MKDKLRGFLGFLGLVEDDYGEYGTNNAPRPFSETPEEFEPEWVAAPAPAARVLPAQGASPSPYRAPTRHTSISVLDTGGGVSRVRPIANPNAGRGSRRSRPSATSPSCHRPTTTTRVASPTTFDRTAPSC